MTDDVIVLCADGSDLSNQALAAGLALLRPGARLVVTVVLDDLDPMLVTGTGFAGGVMSAEAYEVTEAARADEGQRVADATVAALGLEGAEVRIVHGDAGTRICEVADEVGATAIVLGSRGRGGLKRAMLGSVSDHVVRHASCPVVVTGPHHHDHEG